MFRGMKSCCEYAEHISFKIFNKIQSEYMAETCIFTKRVFIWTLLSVKKTKI